MDDLVSVGLWDAVVKAMRDHTDAGLGGVLTEDTLRLATARAIADAGTDPHDLAVEWPHPTLPGSRIDLVIGKPTPRALIEFKYPREPNDKNAAWTMVLGEVLKDLYRLASHPGDVTRLFVYLEGERLRSYMARAGERLGLVLDAERVTLSPDRAALLPATAARIVGEQLAAHHVTATRMFHAEAFDGARLHVYLVDALVVDEPDAKPSPIQHAAATAVMTPTVVERSTARTEILDAAWAVLTRSGRTSFSLAHVRQRDQPYGGHLCRF